MTNDERAMNNIVRVFGIILTCLGALAVWRAIFFLIPYAGFQYGIFMALFGCLFTVVGIVMTVISFRKAKKWKEALAERAALAEQPEQAAPVEQIAPAEQADEAE